MRWVGASIRDHLVILVTVGLITTVWLFKTALSNG